MGVLSGGFAGEREPDRGEGGGRSMALSLERLGPARGRGTTAERLRAVRREAREGSQ